jgi:hypothetical protein
MNCLTIKPTILYASAAEEEAEKADDDSLLLYAVRE